MWIAAPENRTRRVNLFEPCQHIIDVPGGGDSDNWSILNKISTSLGGVWKQSPSSLLYTVKISTDHTWANKASHRAQFRVSIHNTLADHGKWRDFGFNSNKWWFNSIIFEQAISTPWNIKDRYYY